jgi:hypothetical protein
VQRVEFPFAEIRFVSKRGCGQRRQTFFKDGRMPEGVNDTTIVLIPKVQHPETLKEYRPISLCNVVYKIVSKCLVNRL